VQLNITWSYSVKLDHCHSRSASGATDENNNNRFLVVQK
jgi:hypothetical protein